MYNRQLHEEEGELIRKKHQSTRSARGSASQTPAILTGQAQRQADSEAAKRFAENSSARAFLAEISLGLQGSGFAYLTARPTVAMTTRSCSRAASRTARPDHLVRRGLEAGTSRRDKAHDSDGLGFGPGGCFARYRQLSEESRGNREGGAGAARRADKAEAAQDFTRVRVLDDKLTNISLMQNGGLFDLSEGLTWEQREILGMALQAGWMAGSCRFQVRAMVAKVRVEASGGKAQGSTGSSHADAASDGQPALKLEMRRCWGGMGRCW